MRFFNRIIACLSACVITASSVSLPAYADNDIDNMKFGGNYMIVDMDEYQKYIDSLTDEQRKILDEKEQMLADIMDEPSNGTYATGRAALIDLSKKFTNYYQRNNDYCIPACVESVLRYINDDSPTQSEIHKVTQFDFAQICGYVNSWQNQCFYSIYPNPKKETIVTCIKVDITKYDVPTFLGIVDTPKTWYYETEGHCILSNGVYDDLSKVLIADPLYGLIPSCPAYYEKTASEIYDVTNVMCW